MATRLDINTPYLPQLNLILRQKQISTENNSRLRPSQIVPLATNPQKPSPGVQKKKRYPPAMRCCRTVTRAPGKFQTPLIVNHGSLNHIIVPHPRHPPGCRYKLQARISTLQNYRNTECIKPKSHKDGRLFSSR